MFGCLLGFVTEQTHFFFVGISLLVCFHVGIHVWSFFLTYTTTTTMVFFYVLHQIIRVGECIITEIADKRPILKARKIWRVTLEMLIGQIGFFTKETRIALTFTFIICLMTLNVRT